MSASWLTKTVEFHELQNDLNAFSEQGWDVVTVLSVNSVAVIVARKGPPGIVAGHPLDVDFVEVPGPTNGPQLPLKKKGKRR